MLEFGIMENWLNDENSCFDIFEVTCHTNELVKELVNKELLMFKRYQIDVKDIKCYLTR
jgi:hypothetical protein